MNLITSIKWTKAVIWGFVIANCAGFLSAILYRKADILRSIPIQAAPGSIDGRSYSVRYAIGFFGHVQGAASGDWYRGHVDWAIGDPEFADTVAEVSFGVPFASHSFTAVRFSKSTAPVIVSDTACVAWDHIIPLRIDGIALFGNIVVYTVVVACGFLLVSGLRQSRTRPGHCTKCGYDLVGCLKRCPECGQSNVRGS